MRAPFGIHKIAARGLVRSCRVRDRGETKTQVANVFVTLRVATQYRVNHKQSRMPTTSWRPVFDLNIHWRCRSSVLSWTWMLKDESCESKQMWRNVNMDILRKNLDSRVEWIWWMNPWTGCARNMTQDWQMNKIKVILLWSGKTLAQSNNGILSMDESIKEGRGMIWTMKIKSLIYSDMISIDTLNNLNLQEGIFDFYSWCQNIHYTNHYQWQNQFSHF